MLCSLDFCHFSRYIGLMTDARTIMNRAWKLARRGARRFGGRPVDYFRASLRIAWSEAGSVAKAVDAARANAVQGPSLASKPVPGPLERASEAVAVTLSDLGNRVAIAGVIMVWGINGLLGILG